MLILNEQTRQEKDFDLETYLLSKKWHRIRAKNDEIIKQAKERIAQNGYNKNTRNK